MDGAAKDRANGEIAMGDARKEASTDQCSSSGNGGCRLFDRKRSIHQIVGDGQGNSGRFLLLFCFLFSTLEWFQDYMYLFEKIMYSRQWKFGNVTLLKVLCFAEFWK